MILIPIGADSDISSITFVMDKYGIKQSDLPVILINENIKINKVEDLSEIEQYLI